jgi:beta-galactosidase
MNSPLEEGALTRRRFLMHTAAGVALTAVPCRTRAAVDSAPVPTGSSFGAVYFRGQNNPPREDWERDHRVAEEDGHTLFRHWVSWNVVEVAPGTFEWSDYERMLDLAAKNAIRVVLAEMIVDFPEWLIGAHPEARIEMASGVKRQSEMHGSSMNGGHHALCLNHAVVREAAERFLTAMATRFRGHPALLGYDIWNECTEYTAERLCFCGACQASFRNWLREKHGDIATVARRWHRPSLTAFDQIELPRAPGLFPDFLDSIRWRNDDAQHWMSWRRDVLKKADPQTVIIAHGNARTHADASVCVGDDFRAAENCEVFGYTHYFGLGNTPLLSGDLIRGASRGKPFWRAEAVGGPQWFRRKPGEPKPGMDELDDPAAIRLDALISMATGATAYMNPRWRSLLDGPLFSAFGWYADDGSRTPKSDEIKRLAQWSKRADVLPLWRMKPARGDVALVLVDESQDWCYAFQGDTSVYAACVRGAHRGLTAAGLSCDFAKADVAQLSDHRVAYVPFPVAMSASTMVTLLAWAQAGGQLVLEACAGYFDEQAHVFPQQPNRALGELFGPIVERSSFALDQHDGLKIKLNEGELPCALYRQIFQPAEGTETLGQYEDGSPALVRRSIGSGSITLIGSNPSYAMQKPLPPAALAWLRSLLPANAGDLVVAQDHIIRFFTDDVGTAAWIINPTRQALTVALPVPSKPIALRGELTAHDSSTAVATALIPERDAVVLRWLK